MILGQAWVNKKDLAEQLFDKDQFKRTISIKYFDMPGLHLNTDVGKEFWNSLAGTEDLKLFNTTIM